MPSATFAISSAEDVSRFRDQYPDLIPELYKACWYEGELSFLLRRHGQARLYNHYLEKGGHTDSLTPLVWNCHRRLGKSFLLALLAIMRCIRKPYQQGKYAAPSREQCSSIVRPNIAEILRTCPDDLRPEEKKNTYIFRNPMWGDDKAFSVLELAGCDYKKGDALRGAAADFFMLDEVGWVRNLEYLMTDVISYQFIGREDPVCIMATTPPSDMSHPFVQKYAKEATYTGHYMRVRASDNKDFTERDEKLVLAYCGQKGATSYQREAECEFVADESELIVPEWQHDGIKESCVSDLGVPEHFNPEVSIDTGWTDHSGAVFYYIDFLEQKLVVEDELFIRYTTTGDLVRLCREKEKKLWGEGRKVRRIADATEQQLADMGAKPPHGHGYFIQAADKHDKDATLAQLRNNIAKRKIVINPRCKSLLFQLDYGIWNETRRDWARTEMMGHCDLIAALQYANRCARWRKNPYPAEQTSGRDINVFTLPRRRVATVSPVVEALRRAQ